MESEPSEIESVASNLEISDLELESKVEGALTDVLREITLTKEQEESLRLKLRSHIVNGKGDFNPIHVAHGIEDNLALLDKPKVTIGAILKHHDKVNREEQNRLREKLAHTTEYTPAIHQYTTADGKYMLVQLNSGYQLEKETADLGHCVGGKHKDVYMGKIARGESFIFSFRTVTDTSLVTLRYDINTRTISEIEKSIEENSTLKGNEEYFPQFAEALSYLKRGLAIDSEAKGIEVDTIEGIDNVDIKPNHFLTNKGQVSFRQYTSEDLILIKGKLKPEEIEGITDEEKVRLAKIYSGMAVESADEIALSPEEITEATMVYLGNLTPKDYEVLNSRKNPLYINGYTDFEGCTTLTKIPKNITFNGEASFVGCTALTEIPASVTFKSSASFEDCTTLEKISDDITFNDWTNFAGCKALSRNQKDKLIKMKQEGKIKGILAL